MKERKLMNDKHKIEIENIRTQYQNEMAVNSILELYLLPKFDFYRR
jgi:hypothetical protein